MPFGKTIWRNSISFKVLVAYVAGVGMMDSEPIHLQGDYAVAWTAEDQDDDSPDASSVTVNQLDPPALYVLFPPLRADEPPVELPGRDRRRRPC